MSSTIAPYLGDDRRGGRDNGSATEVDALVGKIGSGGGSAVKTDVSKEGDVIRLVDEAVAAFERTGIVVATSRIQNDAPGA